MKVKDMQNLEKPREKLERYGPSKLLDFELIAILLGTGKKGKDVIQVSKEISQKFKDLKEIKVEDLTAIEGVGKAKASVLVSALELGKRQYTYVKGKEITSAKQVWEELAEERKSKKEHFVILLLDTHSRLIKKEIISVGTLTASLVHPREVFEPAIINSAYQIILAHNHPSGNLDPSIPDLKVTEKLQQSGQLLGIKVADHVIVSDSDFISLSEQGYLNFN